MPGEDETSGQMPQEKRGNGSWRYPYPGGGCCSQNPRHLSGEIHHSCFLGPVPGQTGEAGVCPCLSLHVIEGMSYLICGHAHNFAFEAQKPQHQPSISTRQRAGKGNPPSARLPVQNTGRHPHKLRRLTSI